MSALDDDLVDKIWDVADAIAVLQLNDESTDHLYVQLRELSRQVTWDEVDPVD